MIIEGKISPYKHKLTKLFEITEEILEEDFSNVNVSLNFVSEDEIRELNNNFREIDKVTDVLSFPFLEKKTTEKLINFSKEKVDGILFLGDIVICKNKAVSQAKEYGHSLEREICFLALHGLLHLLGYDHIEKSDELVMQEKAKQILDKFGVVR